MSLPTHAEGLVNTCIVLYTCAAAKKKTKKTMALLQNQKKIYQCTYNEECTSFEGISSNHWIILAKICVSLCRNRTQIVSQCDWSSLINSDIRNHYKVTVKKILILFKRYL